MIVQLPARHPGLDAAIHVLGVDLDHLAHPGKIDRDTAMKRRHMALERGAGAERDERALVPGADLDDGGGVPGRARERHPVGGMGGVIGLVPAVLFANAGGGREAPAQKGAQFLDHRILERCLGRHGGETIANFGRRRRMGCVPV